MNARPSLVAVQAAGQPIAGPAALLAFATAVIVTTEFIVVGLLPEMARDLSISIVEAGWFVSSFALSSALFGPPLTMVAGRMEPRRAFEVVLLVFAVGNLAAILAPSFGMVLAVRIVEGAALPVLVSVGSAVIARLAGPGRAGEAVGLLYLGVVVAIVVAVPAGVLIADRSGWQASFLALAALAAIGIVSLRAFPRLGLSEPTPVEAQAKILSSGRLYLHLALSAVVTTGTFTAYTYLAAFLETVAGLDGPRIALVLAGFGTAGVIGNWLAARFADSGPTGVTAIGTIVLMLATAAASLAGASLVLLLPALAVWGAAHTAMFLLCQVRVMAVAPAAPAFAAALNISAANAGIAAGALTGGFILDTFGIAVIGYGAAMISAVAVALAVVLLRTGDR